MSFGAFIRAAGRERNLVVQPRMGLAQVDAMRQGLSAVKSARAPTVGTITLDSYTRVGDHQSALRALAERRPLNGFPIVAHGNDVTRAMLAGLQDAHFPIQVRHGSARPQDIFRAIKACGIAATEGGPISYCLPYGRVPLAEAVQSWRECCDMIASPADAPGAVHLESFGGCMLGQMCPPAMLLSIAILEGLFFMQHGVYSLSLSYAQQTSIEQDIAALHSLRRLAERFLAGADWHVVLYTYMGVFPRSPSGARDLLGQSVQLAYHGGAERLIVKTVAEAHRIPNVAENIESLEFAAERWRHCRRDARQAAAPDLAEAIFQDALSLIHCVLNQHADIGQAMLLAFEKGYLDIPYCLHADTRGRARSYIDVNGMLQWHAVGAMPIPARPSDSQARRLNPYTFLSMLSYVERRFDQPYLRHDAAAPPLDQGAPRRAVQ